MVKRSLEASLTGIQEAKRVFARKGWTQDNLAAEVNLSTRQPIWRFFSGRPVERHTFIEICSVLSLNWREIATNPPAEFLSRKEYAQPTVINYRNINHEWQFNSKQQQVLQRYYDANQLLLDCLHSNCEVTAAIRQEIEATLLLPIKELEDREWQ
jgi:predicted NACHT family NTPase